MNIIKTSKITKISALSALVFVFGTLTLAAPQVHAYGGGDNNRGGHNSYYGGATYYPSTPASTVTVSDPVTVNVEGYAPVSTPIYPVTTLAYNYPTNYYPTYAPTYYNDNYAQLSASCYAQTTNVNAGQNVIWTATASGGNGNNYTYSWSGTDGLYGYGPTISYAYNTSGTMIANVTVTSNGQSVSIPCNSSVIVNGNNYNYNYGYNYGTNYNYNYGNYYNGNSLSATCNANTSSANIGQGVTWAANVTGGSGYYTYSWSGSNNLYGSAAAITATYNTPGTQYAQVTVTSNSGQSVTAQCTNSVVIGNGDYSGGNNNNNGLTIGCAADASTVHPGTPVTWSVEVSGGNGNYTYAWSGTDALAGSQSSVATTYETTGTKQAVVIVTSSNGMTGSKSCTPVSVIGYGGNGNGNVGNGNNSGGTTVTPASNGNNSGLSAASLFSLANIPWGWVAVLIILVLFGTVMYMLFNKSKI